MKHAIVVSTLALLIGLVALTHGAAPAAASPPAGAAAAASYKVDPVHSVVIFKVKHMGAGNFYGRFNQVSGTFTIDAADPSKGMVDFQVKADSIDTANKQRDDHLKGPDFFNVVQFPSITFKGKEIKKAGENAYEVAGDLTLHGVTKPLKAKVEQVGTGKGRAGEPLAGFEATFTVKRGDFGMTYGGGALGEEVSVIVSVECASS
jgi:polyisoprenoid-binding protein YceI